MTIENKLKNAITEMLREIERCPEDSVQDIVNESLRTWETGLYVTHNYVVKSNPLLSNAKVMPGSRERPAPIHEHSKSQLGAGETAER